MATGNVITSVGKNLALKYLYGSQISGTISILRCGSGSTTPAVTDTGLANAAGSYYSVISGYPSYDEANKKVTTRYFINSVSELNGIPITEFGEFFSGTSATLFSRDVITQISKSGSDEIAIVHTTKAV